MSERYRGNRDEAVTTPTLYARSRLGSTLLVALFVALGGLASAGPARAADPIGQIKTATGAVTIERDGARQPAAAGDRVLQSDVVATGADGSVGITFADNSMMSLGPDSALALDSFKFDTTTHDGLFDSSLRRGTLAVKSGYIVQQGPPGESMHVRTPAAVLGVRGTEFVVRAEAPR
jgi:hypothetical protein